MKSNKAKDNSTIKITWKNCDEVMEKSFQDYARASQIRALRDSNIKRIMMVKASVTKNKRAVTFNSNVDKKIGDINE